MSIGSRPGVAPLPQAQVMAFLDSSLAFGSRPRRVDTHTAVVFLTQDRAWKIKREIELDHLNFSTPVRRRAALDAELKLNQRLASEMYRAVHPIVRSRDGRLQIGGDGDVLDWVLEMRRFPEDALLATRARAGLLDTPPLLRLAERLSGFYEGVDVYAGGDGAARLQQVIDKQLDGMANYRALLAPDLVARLRIRLHEELVRHTPRLNARAQAGRIRHGHGDLHLGNIILIDGEAMPFDCLEYDAELATVDVLFDLAYLLMDLWGHGMQRAANDVFNRFLDMSPIDEDGIALMPLFMAVRAASRAHTLAMEGAAAGSSALIGQAHSRLLLAHAVLDARPLRLVAVGGMPSSDKAHVVRAMAEAVGRAPGARVINHEIFRKRMSGVAANMPMPVMTYAPESMDAISHEIATVAGKCVADGHSVVVDSAFARIEERAAIEEVARQSNVGFAGMWVEQRSGNRLQRGRRATASDLGANSAMAMQTQSSLAELAHWRSLSAERSLDHMLSEARSTLH